MFEIKPILAFVGGYLIVWSTIQGLLSSVEAFYRVRNQLSFDHQDRWLDGLQHVCLLVTVFCLMGVAAVTLLEVFGGNLWWSLAVGFSSAFIVHLRSRHVLFRRK
jgi:hypothetical protein